MAAMKPTLAAALKLLAAAMLLFATLAVPVKARASNAFPNVAVDAVAAPRATETSREVAALLALLRQSACRFERNGRWYDGERAADHLQRKLDYATGRGRTPVSSEQFIDAAASHSSFSGKPYRVQCGDAAPIPARTWFLASLKQLRTRT